MSCGYICALLWMGPGIYRFVRLGRARRRLAGFLLIWYHFLTDLSFTTSEYLLINVLVDLKI